MTNTLGLDIQPELPKTFVRGQTLEFVMELPCDVPKDYFHSSVVGPPSVVTDTALKAELRRLENAAADALIADLNAAWEPNTNYTKIRFKVANTSSWPIGPAEFDVLLTRTVTTTPPGSADVKTFRSLPVRITIQDGVTA
jgi:hypothetical protein